MEKIRIQIRNENELKEQVKAEWLENCLTAKKLYDRAKEIGAWIYDPAIKRWYTPEEFLRLYAQYYLDHKLFYQVKLKNPVEGLDAGYKQLEMLQNRLKDFSKRIIDYYQKK